MKLFLLSFFIINLTASVTYGQEYTVLKDSQGEDVFTPTITTLLKILSLDDSSFKKVFLKMIFNEQRLKAIGVIELHLINHSNEKTRLTCPYLPRWFCSPGKWWYGLDQT